MINDNLTLKNGISILMSVYRNTKLSEFKQTIKSIKDQILPPNQIVLTIDGPISSILDYYIKYDLRREFNKKLSIYKISYNSGLPNALNHGMKLVKYNLIARVDTDDILTKERLFKQKKAFDDDNSLSIIGGYVEDFHTFPGDLSTIRKVPSVRSDIIDFGRRRNPLNHPTVMIKTRVLFNLGGYPNFHLFEDYALWITAISKGYKVLNLPTILVYMRVGNNSLGRRGGLKYFFNYLRLEKYFYCLDYISIVRLLINSFLMLGNAILPVGIKSVIYKRFLRKRE